MSIVSELLVAVEKLPAVDAKGGLVTKLAGTSPLALLLGTLAAAALAYGGKRLVKFWGDRAAAKKALGPETLRPSTQPATPDIPPRQLRRAWLRFLLRLPREYRRSILNFEHFVLLGRAGSGKSRLLETHTDYRYQMRQVAGDAPLDPELPVVLASGAIITELPSRFLDDETLQGKVAIERLWGPLYTRRSPTVVLAVDATWLIDAAREDILELARCARSKVNILSAIRKKPVELRVAFTHLDGLDGARETARFWSQVGISACMPLDSAPTVEESVDAWEREANAQLPRALGAVTAEQYRRVLAFTRGLPKLLAPLTTLVRSLFAVDLMSQTPLRGGVFFCTDAPSSANPLRNAHDAGPGPNPLRQHVQLAVASVIVCVSYMTLAFNVQEDVWAPAADAAAAYEVSPALAGTERERTQRERIDEFTVKHAGILYRFPDFHGRVRRAMRAQLSTKLREALLVPRLQEVAQLGIARSNGMTLRWRRSVYFLSLIHSFVADQAGILPRLALWQSMTELPPDLIRDYIANTDTPYQTPVLFKLAADAKDERDKPAFWEALPLEVNKALSDGILREEELTHLQSVIKPMTVAIERFQHDDVTLKVFANIDAAADIGGEHDGNPPPRLYDAYLPQYDEILKGIGESDMQRQSGQISRLLTMVQNASVSGPEEKLLHDLNDRLAVLMHTSKAIDVQPVEVELKHTKYFVDVKKWNEALSDGRAAVLINRFLAATARLDSIFFSQ
ncbi:MAG TPA: type VI secretion protein IcmF/TssM N-terminal domain-containing protein, partial [Polyangiaceae bacterium]|nr:type VI secretion protein IcmF/TssM N-terminal domain-containing protein [Polyangiaceae bacterium]